MAYQIIMVYGTWIFICHIFKLLHTASQMRYNIIRRHQYFNVFCKSKELGTANKSFKIFEILLSIFVYWSTIVVCKCYFWLVQRSQEFDSEDHDSKHYLLEMYTKTSAEYFIYIDASVHITVETIPELVSYQKPVISPLCKFVVFY